MNRSSAAEGNRGTRSGLRTSGYAAPGDLQRHPEGLRPDRLLDPAGDVADDADVLVLLIGVGARRVADRVDVDAADVERGTVRDQPCDGAARRLHDHERMVGVERIHRPVPAREVGRRNRERRVERVARLVLPLPGAESRMRRAAPPPPGSAGAPAATGRRAEGSVSVPSHTQHSSPWAAAASSRARSVASCWSIAARRPAGDPGSDHRDRRQLQRRRGGRRAARWPGRAETHGSALQTSRSAGPVRKARPSASRTSSAPPGKRIVTVPAPKRRSDRDRARA